MTDGTHEARRARGLDVLKTLSGRDDAEAQAQRLEDPDRFLLALYPDQIDLEERQRVSYPFSGLRTDHDGYTVRFRLTFEPRCDVHGIAKCSIVEPDFTSHITNNAKACVYADSNINLVVSLRFAVFELFGPFLVELINVFNHFD